MSTDIESSKLTNLFFIAGYFSQYRYHKQKLLENEHDNLQILITDLEPAQYDNLQIMIEIEMIVNAVQYCSEFGFFAICTKKQRYDFIYMFPKLAEKDIGIFFEHINDANLDLIKKHMGFHEIDITEPENIKYYRSCLRYKEDVKKLSEFYLDKYPIYLSYKHGLRLMPLNNNSGKKIIMEVSHETDNSLGIHVLPDMWWLDVIEITEIINNIYNKLYIPLIRKQIGKSLGISFGVEKISKTINSTETSVRTGLPSLSIEYSLPWWIHDGKEPDSIY